MNLGRNTRTITAPLRRALNIRDECCRFPGCNCNRYVHFHHIKFWGCLGETEPDNLIKLCRFHHALLHRGHFAIEPLPDDKVNRWQFLTPMGDVIAQVPKYPKLDVIRCCS